MAIVIGQSTTPACKLSEIGDFVEGHLCYVREVPWIEYGTQRPKLGKDGKPRTQERLTLIVTVGNAKIGSDGERVQPGDTVAVYLHGARRWSWIEAKRKRGDLTIGDVVRVTYARDEKGQAAQAKHIWDVTITPTHDAEATARAESVYHREESRKNQPMAASGSGSAEDYADPDEAPALSSPNVNDGIPF